MLHQLGLEKYEKNFKKGLLNDQTLPLLTDRYIVLLIESYGTLRIGNICSLRIDTLLCHFSALRDVKIPPGPRLLILDQIKRFVITALALHGFHLLFFLDLISLCVNLLGTLSWYVRSEVAIGNYWF